MSLCAVKAQRQNKIGYIDMNYILKSIPEYNEANAQLDAKIQQWKTEIDNKWQAIENLKQALENERPLLTQDLIEEREEEIKYQEEKLQEYQQQRFGSNGDMMKQSAQIAKPIEDQVFNIIQEIGESREYDFIFDSSSDALMLFSAERHDISDQILASINRNANRLKQEKNSESQQLKNVDEEQAYKSVRQARIDTEKRRDREAEIRRIEQERQARSDSIRAQRDRIRDTKIEEQNARRKALEKRREMQRDSIDNLRQKLIEERQRKRDSILRAREKTRENL